MTSRLLLLTVHLVAVAGWLGANLLQLVLTPRLAKESPEVAAAWSRHTVWLGERYYNVAGALIGISGVLLVLDGDWSWGSGFIWVGVSVIVLGGVMGVAGFAPLMRKRIAALEAGDGPAARAALNGVMRLAVLDTAFVVTAVVAMVHRWQAG